MTAKEKDTYKEGAEYSLKEVSGKIGGKTFQGIPLQKVKQFVSGYTYKSNKKFAKCQIKDCYDVGNWIVNHKGKGIILCFKHGEDC